MENKELLNPESEENKKEQGVENLKSETDQKETVSDGETDTQESQTPDTPQVSSDEIPEAKESSTQPESKPEEQPEDASVSQKETHDETEEKKPEPQPPVSEAAAADQDVSQHVTEQPDTPEMPVQEKEPLEESTPDPSGGVPVESDTTTDDKASQEPDSAKESTVAEPAEEEKKEPQVDKVEAEAIEKKEPQVDKAEATPQEEEEDLSEKYNSLSKEELVEIIESLVMHEDINYIRRHIGFIKVAFRNFLKKQSETDYEKSFDHKEAEDQTQSEPVQPEVDELVVRFDKAFGVYKQKKTVYDQALEKQKQDNLKLKEDILEELRQLIDSEEELKKTYDLFKELQERWREIGPVPQGSKNTLWNNYHFLVEKFFDKVKINKELRDLDLKKNLESKTELCEKAEELLLETSINKSFQKLQKLHEAWKEVGPVPKDKKDEIWDRFKAASDTLNDRRQSYYSQLREEQEKNYSAKMVLCEKAEQLADFTSDSPRKWQEATNSINELFKVWKTIGFAPKKVNDEVWVRFRTSLDNFFKSKKEFFSRYKEEQTENYNQKLNLCVQAEALKDSEDWKQTTDELIALQQQWKKIGPVPKKFSDKIWKRFRAACDEFFNKKQNYFANIGEKQEENLTKKKELIEKIKSYEYSTDNNENLNTLKDFQRQWMEIGHVPIKQKDAIQNEFRKTINEQFDKLNISRKAKSTLGFKNKLENIKNSPNADNILYKERSFLQNKINALQNDIKLWENNIGFFASSKKADVLKLEFEKKIDKARADIAIMEEKLKILNAS